MHVISQKRIVEAKADHPTAAAGLDRWYRLMKGATLGSFAEVRSLFPDADHVGEYYVFNIGGNQLRLIATLHLNRRKCYIREILTHAEYDRWKP
jgi:mRNA interferase HigB